MANPIVPRTRGSAADPESSRPLDIFSAMRDEMDRVFDRFNQGWPGVPQMFEGGERASLMPDLDIKDTGRAIVIEAELPGVEEKDVALTIRDGVLTIKGEKRQSKEEKDETHYVMERSYGSFMRSVQLPPTVDESKVQASFENGVLRVTAQKKAEAARSEKRIEIRKS